MKAPGLIGGNVRLGVLWILCAFPAWGGQFKRIAIDGDFDDWLGVPVPVTGVDEAGDANGAFDFRDIAIANDDAYLYVRARLHEVEDYAGFHHQVLVDTDADSGTGHAWGGVGSELFVENGISYQQKNGQFNEGGGSGLEWAVSPNGASMQFEMRLSRETRDADGLPFFGGDEVTVSLITRTLDWQVADSLESVPYVFATEPEPFQGSRVLTDFEDTFWFYQEVGDPEPDWLLPDYLGDDTWQGGNGFFQFGFDEDTFEKPEAVTLAAGRTTYYFRTPFLWEHAAEGVALLAEAHISDGAVVYLNGDEIRRLRMPDGPIDGSTAALESAASPGVVETFSLPASALIVGENLLMVEVHQAPDSLDSLAFGLRLTANDNVPPRLEDPDQPEDREVVEGEGTVFELGAIAGTEPYDFQWFKDGERILGATEKRYAIPVVLQGDAGAYEVEVSNGTGAVRSRTAALTTSALPVLAVDESLPRDQQVFEGQGLELSFEVTGSPEMSYQWFKDEVAIGLATESRYVIEAASMNDSGGYHVVVGNRVNQVISRTAQVTVQGDRSAPSVTGIQAGGGRVTLTFSERLDADAATELSHYVIPGVPLSEVLLGEDESSVTLVSAPLAFGQEYRLVIEKVEDLFGNALRATVPFRASIRIDGDFSDWEGLEAVAVEAQEGDGAEFHRFWAANDASYLYLRFSFHRELGPLPGEFF